MPQEVCQNVCYTVIHRRLRKHTNDCGKTSHKRIQTPTLVDSARKTFTRTYSETGVGSTPTSKTPTRGSLHIDAPQRLVERPPLWGSFVGSDQHGFPNTF